MKRLSIIFAAVSLLSFKVQPKIFTTNTGMINFRSEAPLELINAESKELKGAVDADKRTFAFRIRIRSFEGFNSPLQKEHFNENYMESVKIPEALFSGKIIEDVDLTIPGVYTIRAKGILNIHGVPRERIIKSDVEVKNGMIKIKSNFTVLLSDHNIPIPRVVKEKLANEIKVELTADLVRK
ncbi:MAG: YceI family protein [Chitinophagaceae bacterium]|nr:YceI family protein [Chitinophagaceae bacterium]